MVLALGGKSLDGDVDAGGGFFFFFFLFNDDDDKKQEGEENARRHEHKYKADGCRDSFLPSATGLLIESGVGGEDSRGCVMTRRV